MKHGFSRLLICIVTVAGVAALLLGIDLVSPFRSSYAIVRREPEPDASSQVKTKQASKPARSHAVIEPARTREVSTHDPSVAGGQIPSAAHETTVNTYGEAALSITRLDRGHDFETLVYARNRGKEITVVSLEDGKVSSHSPSGITATVDSPGPRPDEHATALLARPTEPQPASIAIPPAAGEPMTIPRVFDKTLAEVPIATKPPSLPPVKGNVGTCGEYRDGKLTVKPCSQVPLSSSEWLAKGAGAARAESAPTGNGH